MKNSKKGKGKSSKKNSNVILGVVAVIVIGIAAFTFLNSKNEDENLTEQPKPTATSVTDEKGDMVIPKADVTDTATFYAYDELDTYMEILAVKASDGTVRTAFNTCQVCYSSGRGYYVQEGDVLVCQNCGNRFKMDEVEVARGGCNPVPIFKEMKTETDSTITIPKDLLVEAEGIFANWKN
ncbi:MAG: Fe-S-containing protein [Sedimentibacter sp.]